MAQTARYGAVQDVCSCLQDKWVDLLRKTNARCHHLCICVVLQAAVWPVSVSLLLLRENVTLFPLSRRLCLRQRWFVCPSGLSINCCNDFLRIWWRDVASATRSPCACLSTGLRKKNLAAPQWNYWRRLTVRAARAPPGIQNNTDKSSDVLAEPQWLSTEESRPPRQWETLLYWIYWVHSVQNIQLTWQLTDVNEWRTRKIICFSTFYSEWSFYMEIT